jgi:hypothetical protein
MCARMPFLWGRAFTVMTDHYSLKFLLDQRLSTIPSKLRGYRSGFTTLLPVLLQEQPTVVLSLERA